MPFVYLYPALRELFHSGTAWINLCTRGIQVDMQITWAAREGADDHDVHARSSTSACMPLTSSTTCNRTHCPTQIIVETGSPEYSQTPEPIFAEIDNASETHTLQRSENSQISDPSPWPDAKHFDPEQAALDLQVCIHFDCDCG